MKRNVYLTIAYTTKKGKATIIFSIDPEGDTIPRLVNKIGYSVACRVWVQESSTSYGFSKITIANNDGKYDWLLEEKIDTIEVADSDISDYGSRTVQATGLYERGRFDGDRNIEITIKDPKKKMDVKFGGADFPASETSTVSPFPTNDYGAKEGTPRPFLMNFGYSITPVLLNRSLNEYQFHDKDAFGIYDVYDNGVSVSYVNEGSGKFSLSNDPTENGIVTVDARGEEISGGLDWANFFDEVIEEVFDHIGWTDYDASNISSMQSKPDTTGGVYRPKPTFYSHPENSFTQLEILQWMCDSCTAYNYIDPTGDLIFGYLKKPEDETTFGTIDEFDTVKQFNVFDDTAPKITTSVGVTRNWTVLTTEQIAASVPEEDVHAFTQQWRFVMQSAETLDPFYQPLNEPQDSLLPGTNQGQDHIDNLVDIYSVKRKFKP